ncbi:MAG: hypothetical protein WAQ53_16340 [Thiofilum sp.]|uniref:hypothetical protein n=1 Tax=Thiofilum sp. TaxID=2212733 RepID=UPI0025FFD025|nr:hypothetical protein [Thiofilum sp.]MBK8452418.1 hypothetical protein [Thiofilum sp.]
MNNINFSMRYTLPSYQFPLLTKPMYTPPMYTNSQPNWMPNQTGFNNPLIINTLIQILQRLIAAMNTSGQTTPTTPTTPSNKATILISSNVPGMSEYHRHTEPGKPSPLVRHNQAEDYKEILVQTPVGPRIVANPGPQIVADANLSNKLKQYFNINSSVPFTTTIYDNDRSGAISVNDLIYMNDNVTGAQLKEHLLSAADAKALGLN